MPPLHLTISGTPVVNSQPIPYLLLKTISGNRYFPLVNRNSWTIGRGGDSDFVIPDQWISRSHAMLQCKENGEFYLIDLGSRNGSFVNGRRVVIPITLKHLDHVTLGQTELEFHYPLLKHQAEEEEEKPDTLTHALYVRQLISVMVIDIRDFTLLTRKLDEQTLSSLLVSWFHQSGDILREYGSWVDKYIGDAIMALWFHGDKKEVCQEQVVQIFQAVSDIHKMTVDLSHQYPLPFDLRIGAGINTGYAMVGNYTGTGDRPDYTAIGDTVNAAFRLESATKQIQLNVALGEMTYKYLAKFGQAQQRFQEHLVELKGYETPTLTYAATFEEVDNFLLDKLVQEYR